MWSYWIRFLLFLLEIGSTPCNLSNSACMKPRAFSRHWIRSWHSRASLQFSLCDKISMVFSLLFTLKILSSNFSGHCDVHRWSSSMNIFGTWINAEILWDSGLHKDPQFVERDQLWTVFQSILDFLESKYAVKDTVARRLQNFFSFLDTTIMPPRDFLHRMLFSYCSL